MLTAFQYFEYFWFTISHYFSRYIIGRISIRTLISEQVASYKYLFVHELSDKQSGLNPLGNCVSYIAPCLIPNLYIIMIILFTNYIISHYRLCGGEGRGYVCIFVLYYCRISMEIECSLKWDEVCWLLQNDIPFSLNESFYFHAYRKECYFRYYIWFNVMFPIQWTT